MLYEDLLIYYLLLYDLVLYFGNETLAFISSGQLHANGREINLKHVLMIMLMGFLMLNVSCSRKPAQDSL